MNLQLFRQIERPDLCVHGATMKLISFESIPRCMAAILVAFACTSNANAEWLSAPAAGTVVAVRSYATGVASGLRVELTLSGANHTCGTVPTIYYYDSTIIGVEAVKAILALSLVAMTAGKSVLPMYDCAYGGGYGWGVTLQIAG